MNERAQTARWRRQFTSFAVAGGIAAIVNVATRWLLGAVLFYELSVVIAYLIGMTVAFLLSRAFVFGASGSSWFREYRRFAMVNAVSLLIVLGVSASLARVILPLIGVEWHREDIAHVIGVVSPILFSFYAHKHYSFGADQGRTP